MGAKGLLATEYLLEKLLSPKGSPTFKHGIHALSNVAFQAIIKYQTVLK